MLVPSDVRFRISNVKGEEDLQASGKSRKRSLSGSVSSQDSCHASDTKMMHGEKSKPTEWCSEEDCNCSRFRASAGGNGGPTQYQFDSEQGSRSEKKYNSRSRHSKERTSSGSLSQNNTTTWTCPQCNTYNFIKSYCCVKCSLPRKNAKTYPIGTKNYPKMGGKY